MLEKNIESDLKKSVEKLDGALCLKFTCPSFTGVPDRIILLPGGNVVFAELKAPGKKERPRQRVVQRMLRELGFIVFSAVDSPAKISEVVDCCSRIITQEHDRQNFIRQAAAEYIAEHGGNQP